MFRSRLSLCGETRLGFSSIGEKNSLPSKIKQIGMTSGCLAESAVSRWATWAARMNGAIFLGNRMENVKGLWNESRGLRMEDGNRDLSILDPLSSIFRV